MSKRIVFAIFVRSKIRTKKWAFTILKNKNEKVARLQDQVGQSEIIPPANCNEKIFGGVD